MANEHLSVLYTCEPYYCKYVTTNESDYLNHIAIHVVPTQDLYECFYCCKLFDTFDDVYRHIQFTYTKIEYECVHCATYFPTKAHFDDHTCEKTVNLNEVYLTMSEWREMEYIMEWNIEN